MKWNRKSFLSSIASGSPEEDGQSGRSGMLKHDKVLFSEFKYASDNSEFTPSEYWKQYTELILAQINREGLSGF
jgi:hypothetical protein